MASNGNRHHVGGRHERSPVENFSGIRIARRTEKQAACDQNIAIRQGHALMVDAVRDLHRRPSRECIRGGIEEFSAGRGATSGKKYSTIRKQVCLMAKPYKLHGNRGAESVR